MTNLSKTVVCMILLLAPLSVRAGGLFSDVTQQIELSIAAGPKKGVAQDRNAVSGPSSVLFYSPPPVLDKSVERAIADSAAATELVILKGETVNDALRRECPGASTSFITYARLKIPFLNSAGTAKILLSNLRTKQDTLIFVPQCIGFFFEEQLVKDFDSLWGYYEEYRDSAEVNGVMPISWQDYRNSLQEINDIQGDSLLSGQVMFFPPRVARIDAQPDEIENLIRQIKEVYGESAAIASRSSKSGYSEISTEGDPEIDDTCFPNDVSIIEDLFFSEITNVAEALVFNRYFLKKVGYGQKKDNASINIALLDTGLRTENYFFDRFANPISLHNDRRRTLSYPGVPNRDHGTAVLGVILGKYFGSLTSSMQDNIRVFSHNIYQISGSSVKDYGAPASTFEGAIKTIKQMASVGHPIKIVNLSNSWPDDGIDENWIKDSLELARDSDFIIVAPAGNGAGDFNNNEYPASYGSLYPNLTIVAATDGNQSIMSKANPERASIAAFGCNIPTIGLRSADAGPRIVYASGTSMAVPSITHAAALIYLEIARLDSDHMPSAIEVQQRILSSSDLVAGLEKSVTNGRLLNLPKALNIFSDNVQLRSGQTIRGRVQLGDGSQDVVDLCSGVRVKTKDLKKLAYVQREGLNSGFVIDYVADGRLKTSSCSSIYVAIKVQSYPLLFEEPEGEESSVREIEGVDVSDIVFAMRPAWGDD